MPITPLPPAPQRQDEPTLITQKADAMFSALPNFVTEANALETNVNAKEVSANAAAVDAQGNALEASNWAKLQNALVPIYDESTNSTSTVGSDYSAKEYAIGETVESAKRHASGTVATGSAKDWATKTNAEVVVGQGFGAKKYAMDAQEEAQAALASASAAASSAIEAGALVEKYLGALSSDPTTDKTGGPLTAGDWYVNTGSGLIRAYTGAGWVNGISTVAGVSSVNGQTGDVSGLATLTGTETLTNKTIVDPILELSGTDGLAGQVPVSQGEGLPPVWGSTLSGAILNDGYTEEVFDVSGTTPALSPTNGSVQTWTLTGNSTPTVGTWAKGQSMILGIDDGSAYTVTWPTITWTTTPATAPTLPASGYLWVVLWKVGTTLYGKY